jgi:hypothetical protein
MEHSLSPFTIASGVVGFISASIFALQIVRFGIKVNLATWTMILVLDFVGLGLLVATGSQKPYIQIGWCVAAILIFLAALKNRGNWQWSATETWSVTACVIAILIWVFTGSVWSLLGYMFAAYISVIPQANQYLKEHYKERRKSAWMWIVTAVAISLAIVGKPPSSELMVLAGLLLLNMGMIWLTLRKP